MSQSNGTGRLPAIQAAAPGAFKRAVERHRKEVDAWRRVQAATRAVAEAVRLRQQALVEYEQFSRGLEPLGPPVGLPGGLVELAEKEVEQAELPDGGEPAVQAFVDRENSIAAEKRRWARRKAADEKKAAAKAQAHATANVPPPPEGLNSWCDLHAEPGPRKKTPSELLAEAEVPNSAAPEPALDRLGQLLDGQDPSRGVGQAAEPTAEPFRPWDSEDLEAELLHALGMNNVWQPEDLPAWQRFIEEGATNEQIGATLNQTWPRSRRFTGPEVSAGKTGYTNQATGLPGGQYFWLGAFRGPGHKATLSGTALVSRVRDVLEIPTPTEAQKRAQATFDVTHTVGGPTHMPKPTGGWGATTLEIGLENLGIELMSLAVFCADCGALRPRYIGKCPSCHCVTIKDVRLIGDPPYDLPAEPAKRGRGRPAGSKTRKAVEA
jgi:hypothetical protein